MGNQQSQVPEAVASSLSPKARRRISKSPFLQTFLENANRPSTAPRNMPSLTSTWYETSSPYYSLPPPPKRKPPQAFANGQQVVSQTTRTTRRPSGNPTAPYYVVSTTTYYIKSPSSRPSSTDGSSGGGDKGSSKSHRSSSVASSISEGEDTTTSSSSDNNVQYNTVEGRKFFTAPYLRYMLPCDEDESDRLIILHFLLKYAFKGNFMAPVHDLLSLASLCANKEQRPQVLDVGCGPGTWVLEMATEFPNSDFHGVDFGSMFPGAIKPSNANFRQCNILKGLPFPNATFDYVHVQLLLSTITEAQAVQLLAEVARVLKPNGYVELRDAEFRIQRPGPTSDTLVNQKMYQMFEQSFDIRLDASHHMSTLLNTCKEGGCFVDVFQECVTIPLGWGGQLGEMHGQNLEAYLRSLDPKIRLEIFPEGSIDEIMRECAKHQSHLNWFGCYGRKYTAAPSPVASPIDIHYRTRDIMASVPVSPSSPIEDVAWESIHQFADGYVD